jgi:bifunctional non-homologous end joining protein LigD
MLLDVYNKKRDFHVTGEPRGKKPKSAKAEVLSFVVQKHDATRLHYDFRLELDGVLKSWAVTKGPSFAPKDKRLAVRTEDHPLSYAGFEGVIPERQYGAGPVIVWDAGTWEPYGDPHQGLRRGHLSFRLHGERMKGDWSLIRMRGEKGRENWLLIKSQDKNSLPQGAAADFLERENTSIRSGRTVEALGGKTGKRKSVLRKNIPAPASLAERYAGVALATLVEKPPEGAAWWHEIKYDGYRILCFIEDGAVTVRTRGHQDWTGKFPLICAALGKLKVKSAVLDGEAVALDAHGTSRFSLLQKALSEGRQEALQAFFFDLLYLDGRDLTALPLAKRQAALKKIIPSRSRHVQLSQHIKSNGNLLAAACRLGAEGIVSKRADASYVPERTRDWLKSKCGQAQEFIVCGFIPHKNDRHAVGALHLGYYEDGVLKYAGKTGTGFTRALAQDTYRRLEPLIQKAKPFKERVRLRAKDSIWVRPVLLCEVSFHEWTADRLVRQAVFKGLRLDKPAAEVRRETPQDAEAHVTEAHVTHADRVVYPEDGVTKGDVVRHYKAVMDDLLPFVAGRPVSLVRCTEGIGPSCFFQRGDMPGAQKHIKSISATHDGKTRHYIYVDDAAGVLDLAQMDAIELHVWGSKAHALDIPDHIIFDLDPGEGVPFDAVRLAARDVRQRMKKKGLETFLRVTGGKGLHIALPLTGRQSWEKVKAFAEATAREMAREVPEAYVATSRKEARRGRIFVDWLRNGFAATAIAPFSLRARPGAPVSAILPWKELEGLATPAPFNIRNIKEQKDAAVKKEIRAYFSCRQSL